MTFRVSGGSCDASVNEVGDKFECDEEQDSASGSTFTITWSADAQDSAGPFSVGDTFTISSLSKLDADTEFHVTGNRTQVSCCCCLCL